MTPYSALPRPSSSGSNQPFDAVLLDLNLPDGNALDVRRARAAIARRCWLTTRNRDEAVAGLDAGADDYLGKPF